MSTNLHYKLTKINFMSNEKSEKSVVGILVAACTIAILIFHFAWFRQLAINYNNALFGIVDVLLFACFLFASYISYRDADDPNADWMRKVTIALAVALCLWAGGWAAYLNEKVL